MWIVMNGCEMKVEHCDLSKQEAEATYTVCYTRVSFIDARGQTGYEKT